MLAPPSAFPGAGRPSPSARGKPSDTSKCRPRGHVPSRLTRWADDVRGPGPNGTTGLVSLPRSGDENREGGVHGWRKPRAIPLVGTNRKTSAGLGCHPASFHVGTQKSGRRAVCPASGHDALHSRRAPYGSRDEGAPVGTCQTWRLEPSEYLL